jgi:hypothetical protein
MVAVGLHLALQAKPGKEEDVASFVRAAVPLVPAAPAHAPDLLAEPPTTEKV